MGQFVVIGLGNFGFNVAKTLYEMGHDVCAVDSDKDKVDQIRDFSTQAVEADACDKDVLKALGIEEADAVVVGLGERLDAPVLVTLYLKELKANRIIVKAVSEDHGKILEAVGATEIVFPEKDMAVKLAKTLAFPNALDHLPLAPGFSIVEVGPPRPFIGKSLSQLDLRNKYHVQIIAIRELIPDRVNLVPRADYVIKDSDILIILGKDEDLNKIKDFD